MLLVIGQRLVQMLFVMFGISVLTFLIFFATPGADPAARLAGFSHLQIMVKEILPAVTPLLLTLISIEMGIAVIVEAILSFVGLSVEPTMPAWGVMIADARQYMYQAEWGLILPVLGIFVTVLGANLLGDGLRRSLDPRLVRRVAA